MASAAIPTVESVLTELLEGETVTAGAIVGSAVPQNPANVNDRDHASASLLNAGFAAGSIAWHWSVDFGLAVEVHRMRVWDPGGSEYWNDPTGAKVQWSDDGVAWTTIAHTYSSATVSTGLVFPAATTTTEYRYAITPATHRYWRIRQDAGPGLFSGRGMSEWFIDGATTGGSAVTWLDAPDTIDASDATSDDAEAAAITETAGPFWRGTLDAAEVIGQAELVLGFEDAGAATVVLQGATQPDYSDAVDVVVFNLPATGAYTADELTAAWDAEGAYQYWQLVLDTAAQGVRVFEVALLEAEPLEPVGAGKAILEIYVHDEDASRWGTATWATGPATGTEGIWSAAGWQDVTPQGLNVHVIFGSRRPSRGILAEQDAASWLVQTYDPDRILDPGNPDSPYAPQLVAGVPIRVSHDSGLVVRTGYIDELSYKYKPPTYRGTILATDTIALLHKASVPADSILSDTLHARVIDAINAAGVAVGGIPLPPPDFGGPALSDWVEGAATDEGTSVWEIVRKACQEVLWVPSVNNDASLGLRSWGAPLERGREISAPNLEDLESLINEDGVYSVARVQVADPDLDPIEREASPLPRYGRRVIDRRETTADPEGWADAVLAERSWPGVQYVPGTIHCFTAADVEYFGSLQIMERVTVIHPGVVSVQGRILGGELWVEHRADSSRGATWMFKFAVATDGSTAIGLTTLVSDQAGEPLLDDATETDFLEAD